MQVRTLAHRVESIGAGYVALTLELPQERVTSMLLFISSMTDLCRSITTKARVSTVADRLEDSQEQRDIFYQKYVDSVVSTFDGFIAKGENPRVALSLTSSFIHESQPNSSYDQVKKILSDAKRLKKTGYYKSPSQRFD